MAHRKQLHADDALRVKTSVQLQVLDGISNAGSPLAPGFPLLTESQTSDAGSAEAEQWREPIWSEMADSDFPPPPHRILFVGADDEDSKLNIEREVKKMEREFVHKKGADAWGDSVVFHHTLFASKQDLVRDLRRYDPLILHFACHGAQSALRLFRADLLHGQSLASAIAAWTEGGDKRLRIVIANACESWGIMQRLEKYVDFVIGHRTPVQDSSAIAFSQQLYGALGDGEHLKRSFALAKMVSEPYCMNGRRNAGTFKFELPVSSPDGTVRMNSWGSSMRESSGGPSVGPSSWGSAAGGDISLADNELSEMPWKEVATWLHRLDIDNSVIRIIEQERVPGWQIAEMDLGALISDLNMSKMQARRILSRRGIFETITHTTAQALSVQDSDLSDAATQDFDEQSEESEGEDQTLVSIAAKHHGHPEDFQAHMKVFIDNLLEFMSTVAPDEQTEHATLEFTHTNQQWTYCMILWLSFAQEADLPSNIQTAWLDIICTGCTEHLLLQCLETGLQQPQTAHKMWSREEFSRLACGKRHAACLFVTDRLVQHLLCAHPESCEDWAVNVVQGWFQNDEQSTQFLLRANRFLRLHLIDSIEVMDQVFKTRSYVAFIFASKLAALLLFAYLEARKLSVPTTPGGGASDGGFCGFSAFVSSDRMVSCRSHEQHPCRLTLPLVFQGLRCLALLPSSSRQKLGLGSTQVPRELMARRHEARHEDSGGESLEEQKKDASLRKIQEAWSADEQVQPQSQNLIKEHVFGDKHAKELICGYLGSLSKTVSSYVDSASGNVRRLDGESVALMFFSVQSFEDRCDEDDRAVEEKLICPISHRLMREPVKCSDGYTYEHANIEKWFLRNGTSPMTRAGLKFRRQGDAKRLLFELDRETLQKIKEFKQAKDEEEERMMQEVEGEEELRLIRARYGHGAQQSAGEEHDDGLGVQSPAKLVSLMRGRRIGLSCLIGPPASGKTVSVLQTVDVAAQVCARALEEADQHGDLGLLLPLFVRASELSALLPLQEQDSLTLRQLVKLVAAQNEASRLLPEGIVHELMSLFDLGLVMVCIDGLDECGEKRELIENVIDDAVEIATKDQTPLHVLLSTREHTYSHSRKCLRLAGFDVLRVQPLDTARQMEIISSRISPGEVDDFHRQLADATATNPELSTSPFLLGLMIEVFKKDGTLPAERTDLYAKQVDGMVRLCINKRVRVKDDALSDVLAFLDHYQLESFSVVRLATEYLAGLAFVCQIQLEKRDFTLEACETEMRRIWRHGPELLASVRELLFASPVVGLVMGIRPGVYRFSHLTIQEYLAARSATWLYGQDTNHLMQLLSPIDSRWKSEVIQFTASMLDECEILEFSKVILQSDDGDGVACEVVRKFLQECRASSEVSVLLRERLHHFRGIDSLVAGLCHVSPQMRELVLSEIKQFRMPSHPFSDGTCARLRSVSQLQTAAWCRRTAAVLSLCQIAKMDHCREGGRSDTIQWLFEMLRGESDTLQGVHFAIISGLGSLFTEHCGSVARESDCIVLMEDDERILLTALEEEDRMTVFEAIADLNIFSLCLIDWLVDASRLHQFAAWPARHVAFMCSKVAHAGDPERLSSFANQILRQLFSPAISTEEPVLRDLRGCTQLLSVSQEMVLPFLEKGSPKQQACILRAAAAAGIRVESFDALALCSGDALPLLEAMAELGSLNGNFIKWLERNSQLVTGSVWPISMVSFVCDTLGSNKQDAQVLAALILHRLHSDSCDLSNQTEVVEVLSGLQASEFEHLGPLVARLVSTGSREARLRVLTAVADAKVQLDQASLLQVARSLISNGEEADGRNYKKRVCRFWKIGSCLRGDRCGFAHGSQEVRGVVCWHWEQGNCKFGDACKFAHAADTLLEYALSTKGTLDQAQSSSSRILWYLRDISQALFGSFTPSGPIRHIVGLLNEHKAFSGGSIDLSPSNTGSSCMRPSRVDAAPQNEIELPVSSGCETVPHTLQVTDSEILEMSSETERKQPQSLQPTSIPRCPNGHQLSINREGTMWWCDNTNCSKDHSAHASCCRRWGCWDCDFDLCDSCCEILQMRGGPWLDSQVESSQPGLEQPEADLKLEQLGEQVNRARTQSVGFERIAMASAASYEEHSKTSEDFLFPRQLVSSESSQASSLSSTNSQTVESRRSIRRGIAPSQQVQELEAILASSASSRTFWTEKGKSLSLSSTNFICTHLWAQSGLVSDALAQELKASVHTEEAAFDFESFLSLSSPFFLDTGSHPSTTDESWLEQLASSMQLPVCGRFLFGILVCQIQERFRADPISALKDLLPLGDMIRAWPSKDVSQRLEKLLLLKELRIGRRSVAFPAWVGSVSSPNTASVHVPLHLKLARGETVASMRVTEVDFAPYSDLLQLPEDLRNFTNRIKHLNLAECRQLTQIPDWIGQMLGLETLLLARAGLTTLPSSIGELTKLRTLDLRECSCLAALPSSIGGQQGLTTLDLGGCSELKELPLSVAGLTRLRTLNMSGCSGLKELQPSMRGLTGLQTLNLSKCSGLEELPLWLGSLTGLEFLDLSNLADIGRRHGMTELPSWMNIMTGLRTLDLSGCTWMQDLPPWIWAMPSLQTLGLTRCHSRVMDLPPPLMAARGWTADPEARKLGICIFIRDRSVSQPPT